MPNKKPHFVLQSKNSLSPHFLSLQIPHFPVARVSVSPFTHRLNLSLSLSHTHTHTLPKSLNKPCNPNQYPTHNAFHFHYFQLQYELNLQSFFFSLLSLSVEPKSPIFQTSKSFNFCLLQKRTFMAKTKPGKKDLDSYTIKGTNKVVHAGDCVLMRPSDSDKPPYVARVEKIEADHRSNVKVRVRWYYRPEESIGGRRQFHGAKELFLSDHYDVQSAHTIEGKCTVHSFKNYTKLENVGAEDYFCRFEYKAATGGFTPDRVAVYCKCEMPYNPDDLMVQCEGCKDWFHPSCMGMSIEEAKKLEQFLCADCSSDDDVKRSLNTFPVSPSIDAKVESKRRKR